MNDQHKTKAQLIAELRELRKRVAELTAARPASGRADLEEAQLPVQLLRLLDAVNDGICDLDKDATIVRCNRRMQELFSQSEEQMVGRKCCQVVHGSPRRLHGCPLVRMRKTLQRETAEMPVGDRWFEVTVDPVLDQHGELTGAVHIVSDITERMRAEDSLRAQHHFLQIANRHTHALPLLREFVAETKDFTGCAAVGIRLLDERGKIPYQAYEGFSQSFYEMESPLSIKSDQCMCINVIKGTTDPSLPFFTEAGSFYMNGTTRFLATVSEDEKGTTRNVCNQVGYESVALIPIHLAGSIVGLIHVADSRENMVPPESVQMLERVAAQLGAALQRVQAEQALRGAEARYRSLVECVPAVVYTARLDEVGGTLYISPQVETTWGFSPEEWLADPAFWSTRLHPDDRERVLAEWGRSGASGELFRGEYRILTRDGRAVWVSDQAAVVRDEAGQPAFMHGMALDITERKEAEEEIKKLSRLPTENPNPVLRIAEDGLVLYANEASAPLLDHWGCEVGRLCPDRWCHVVVDVLRSGSSAVEEIERGDQTILLTLAPVTDSGYVNAYGLDITVRKRLEERLREASRMEAVGTLAGGIAHEFNNLLMAIVSYAHLGAKSARNPKAQQRLARIREVADQGGGLVRQLLALGHRQALDLRVIDLRDLITNTCDMLRPLLSEGIDLRFVPAPDLGHVRGDTDSIRQVLMNLALNARDAMPGGGTLTLEADNVELDRHYAPGHLGIPPGSYVVITVTDTGCGMDRETVSRIFEPFYTTKEIGKGTGLGLATVHGVLRQLGGHIRVESELGRGTVVRVYLPRTDEEPATLPDDAPAGPAAAGRETVLVVEDDAAVRDAVRGILEQSGYTVLCAANADDAEEAFKRQHLQIALVLTDVVMPGRTGYELGRRLAAQRPALKIIYMSGYDDTGAPGRPDPGTVLLRKPIDPEELPRRVREVLDADV